MSKLLQFFTEVALNPMQQTALEKRYMVMGTTTGVSTLDNHGQQLDHRAAWTAVFADELATHELTAVMGSCLASDPGPDPTPDPDPLPEPEPDDLSLSL